MCSLHNLLGNYGRPKGGRDSGRSQELMRHFLRRWPDHCGGGPCTTCTKSLERIHFANAARTSSAEMFK
jgi:hypothetical protein